MSDPLYELYVDLKRKIKQVGNCDKNHNENPTFLEWVNAVEILEQSNPDLKSRYERNSGMQKSFTREQQDFICYQIGEWYLDWKNRIIVDLEEGTHRLGFAKELLKSQICGNIVND